MNNIIENHIAFDYLFAVGDTHGKNLQLASHLLPNVPKESKKAILHVGDFGMGFSSHVGEIDNMAHLDKKLKKDNVWLYVIRGNHDNPAYFDSNNSKHQDMDRFDNVILHLFSVFLPNHLFPSQTQTPQHVNLESRKSQSRNFVSELWKVVSQSSPLFSRQEIHHHPFPHHRLLDCP